jgi:hypothetical protein
MSEESEPVFAVAEEVAEDVPAEEQSAKRKLGTQRSFVPTLGSVPTLSNTRAGGDNTLPSPPSPIVAYVMV